MIISSDNSTEAIFHEIFDNSLFKLICTFFAFTFNAFFLEIKDIYRLPYEILLPSGYLTI